MKGGRKQSRAGFTIIEVMIFLAISGLLFLVAAQFVNGKQAQAEYDQGMQNADAQLTALINDAADGNFQLPSVQCSLSGGKVVATPASNPVPTPGCTVVGIDLGMTTRSDSYSVGYYGGCQYVGCSNLGSYVDNISGENPQLIKSYQRQWPGGVILTSAWEISNSAPTPVSNIGLFSSLPSANNGVLENATQPVLLLNVSNPNLITDTDILPSGDRLLLCFLGPNGKPGDVEIAPSNGGQDSTSLGLGQKVSSACPTS